MAFVKPHRATRFKIGPRLWFLIVVSLAFHGVLLSLPMPQWWLTAVKTKPKPKEILEESGAIALTMLPVVSVPEASEPVEPNPPPEPEVIEELPVQVPEAIVEEIAHIEEPENINDPESAPPEVLPDELPPTPPDYEPEAGIAFAFGDDFPHITDTTPGCGNHGLENCRTINGKNFSDIGRSFSEDFRSQGYKVEDITPEDSEEHNNQIIFKIYDPNNPNAEIKYLNIFGEGLNSAFYVLAPNIVTRADLDALSPET